MQRLWPCRNSIGSSIVRMCSGRLRLIASMMAASVVDLPEPVGPGHQDEPAWLLELVERRRAELLQGPEFRRDHGRPRRATRAGSTRSRGSGRGPGSRREVELALDLEVLLLFAGEDPVKELLSLLRREGRVVLDAPPTSPRTRMTGGVPVVTWRSEAFRSTMCSSSSSIELASRITRTRHRH